MRITGLGHASVLIETAHGTVLTDPWVNPAYFGSWFPFPDNSQLDWDRFGQADYLFVSHLHRDHFDPALAQRVLQLGRRELRQQHRRLLRHELAQVLRVEVVAVQVRDEQVVGLAVALPIQLGVVRKREP